MEIGTKLLYTLDKENQCSYWARRNLDNSEIAKVPLLSDVLGKEEREIKYAKRRIENIGGFWCHGNRVTDNTNRVSLWSTIPNQAAGIPITEDTFSDMISLFTARRLISKQHVTWLNDADNYMIPDTENKKYKQWENDCIVYSLFNTNSYQTSLRKVKFNGEEYDIKNQFFWVGKERIKQLGEKYNNIDIIRDIEKSDGERYVYKRLQDTQLSKDTEKLIEMAMVLLEDSFQYRDEFNRKYLEYQINNWDAGWYQISSLLKYCNTEGLKEFRQYYKEVENRMRELVYELGFLYR